MPKVSVCIPTYNTARFLPETVASVLRQDYGDFELVICDNASTDGTPDLCKAYADPRVRFVRFENLVGQAANWNRCLELATGAYVILLHADDLLREDFLRKAADVLERHPSVNMVHCAVQHIAANGDLLNLQRLHDQERVEAGATRFRQLLDQGCLINPAGVLVRRSAYAEVGKFSEAVVWGVDWHMWLRLSLSGAVGYLAEPLAYYRQHGQSGTTGVMATARNGSDEIWVLDDVFSRIPAERNELKTLYYQARRRVADRTWCHAEQMCRSGHGPAARAGIRQALGIHPGMVWQPRVWGLLASTYFGYAWFQRMLGWKRRLEPARPPM